MPEELSQRLLQALVQKQTVMRLSNRAQDALKGRLRASPMLLTGSLRGSDDTLTVSFRGSSDRVGEVEALFFPDGATRTPAVGRWRGVANLHVEETWPWAVSQGDTYVIQPWLDAMTSPDSADEYLAKRVNQNVRRNVKRAQRAGFVARRTRSLHDAARFYRDFLEPMAHARFGSMVMYGSIEHFLSLNGRTMHTEVVFLEREGRDVAGVGLVTSPPRRNVRIWAYGMSLPILEDARQRADVMAALNVEAVRAAAGLGYSLCFGLTRPFTDDGVYIYKQRWGAHMVPTPEMARFSLRFASKNEELRFASKVPLLVVTSDGIRPLAQSN